VRPLRIAFAACMLCAAPSALLAQSAPQLPPHVRPIPPNHRPHPIPTGGHAHRPNQRRPYNQYPVVIDSSLMDRYLPGPTPAAKRTPAPRVNSDGQDVFETHSTDDAR
jgi:hypothetical protein